MYDIYRGSPEEVSEQNPDSLDGGQCESEDIREAITAACDQAKELKELKDGSNDYSCGSAYCNGGDHTTCHW